MMNKPPSQLKVGPATGKNRARKRIRLVAVRLHDLPWGASAPVDLFERNGNDLHLVFPEGTSIDFDAYPEISARSVALYCDKEAGVSWRDKVEENLGEILRSPLPAKEKAQVVYHSAADLTAKMFQDFSEESYREARHTVDVINRLMSEPGALESFFHLTINHYYTYTHSLHVFLYATMLTRALHPWEMNEEFLNELGVGYLLHDIGKKDIPHEILNKPGKLTDEEFDVIKQHPLVGYDLLEQVAGELSPEVSDIVLQHHERMKGGGYPHGLDARGIGRFSRICALADVFDALTTDRSYKAKLSKLTALTVMKTSKGQFDEDFFARFVGVTLGLLE